MISSAPASEKAGQPFADAGGVSACLPLRRRHPYSKESREVEHPEECEKESEHNETECVQPVRTN
jgi:hypothetical protein